MKLLGSLFALMLAVAVHGQGTGNPGGGGGMNFVVPAASYSGASASNSFIWITGGTGTNTTLQYPSTVGLTNTGGFFLGGTGQIGTNGSQSILTVNMVPVFNGSSFTNNNGGFFGGNTTFGTNNSASTLTMNMQSLFKPADTAQTNAIIVGGPHVGYGAGGGTWVGRDITNCVSFGPDSNGKHGISIYAGLVFGGLPAESINMDSGGITVSRPISIGGGASSLSVFNNVATFNAGYSVGGSAVVRTRTATLSGAAWPELTVIGVAATNLINISGVTTNTSHVLVSVFPVETGCIYRAGVLTNGTAIVIREAIVACPVVTNLVRVTDFGF